LVSSQLAVRGLEYYAPEFPPPPRTRKGSVRDRRRRWVFPGYVFFRPTGDIETWSDIRWAAGVVRILEQDGRPARVSDDVIRHLRRRIAERDICRSKLGFVAGQPVVIERGPLAAVDAIFDRELNASDRVQILVDLMGRQLPVRMDRTDLRPPDR
jgi:transcriptional antiterminator RfaH